KTELTHNRVRENPLVAGIMDGKDRRCINTAPGEIGGHQSTGPVIGMDKLGSPADGRTPCGNLCCHMAQHCKADRVVWPVLSGSVAVRITLPVVKLRTQDDINDKAI